MEKTMQVTGYYTASEWNSIPKHMRFNEGDHMVVKVDCEGTKSKMSTVVLDTPFGVVTVCVIPWADGATGGCLDIQYKDDKFKQTMIGFTKDQPGDSRIHGADLFSLDFRERGRETTKVPSEAALECTQRLVDMAKEESRQAVRFGAYVETATSDATKKHWQNIVQKHREAERIIMRAARSHANEYGINIQQFLKEEN